MQPFFFQLKSGRNSDVPRRVHHADATADDEIHALCGQCFTTDSIVSVPPPGELSSPAAEVPVPICVSCRIRSRQRKSDNDHAPDKYLAWLLLQGQWLLADAQLALLRSVLSEPEHHVTAEVLGEIGDVLRLRADREFTLTTRENPV